MLKFIKLLGLILILTNFAKINANSIDFNQLIIQSQEEPKEITAEEQAEINNLPIFQFTNGSLNKTLPSKVNNAAKPYWWKETYDYDNQDNPLYHYVHHQSPYASCATSAIIGHTLTYETNRLKKMNGLSEIDYHGANPKNRFPVHAIFNINRYNSAFMTSPHQMVNKYGVPSDEAWE